MAKINTTFTVLLFCTLVSSSVVAQNALDDDSTRGWKKSALVGMSVTQAAYSNWKAGGDNAFSGKGSFDVLFEHFSEKVYIANLLQLSYGRSWGDTDGWRKIDDVLRYNFLAAYRTAGYFKPTFSVDFRTQFDDGIDYDLSDEGVRLSTFMAPGYLTETAGLGFIPSAWLKALLGFAAKQTFVLEESLRDPGDPSFPENNGFGNGPDEAVRSEFGLNLNAVASGAIIENVIGRSELSVFAAFDQMQYPDIRWNNLIQLKVNDWLNTTIEAEIFYDNDQSADAQWRQLLALGVAFNLL
ncbi:MAG: DUF3078 domain-containing protein [Rhodothermia bacterium]